MSLTPSMPSNLTLKSFWARPEGKAGAVVLVATGIAAIYGLGLILPWIILLLANTLTAVALGAVLIGVGAVVSNKTFRSGVGNLFQSTMRMFTSIVVEIDPIGILENNVDKMTANNEKLSTAIEGCAGAKKTLENGIRDNQVRAEKARTLVHQCDIDLAKTPISESRKQQLSFQRNGNLLEMQRRQDSSNNLQRILDQTNKLYAMLQRWQNFAEYNIDNTKAEVENAKSNRKSILSAYAGMSFAKRLIKGDPEQLKMVNASLEFLAQDNGRMLGAMDDFSRYSEKFLSNQDLSSEAAISEAEKTMAQYEQKLLLESGDPQAQAQPVKADTKLIS